MSLYPPQGVEVHGTAKHDATVSKKRVIAFPLRSRASWTETTWTRSRNYNIYFDKSKFDKLVSIKLVSHVRVNDVPATAELRLYNAIDNKTVTNSYISSSSTSYSEDNLQRSSDFKDNLPDKEVILQFERRVTSGYTGSLYNAYLEIIQEE